METHALYRFFDAGGDLLYIGITNDPGRRWGRHATDKPWWIEVDRIELERYPDRTSVLDAEQKAIKEERPRYNVLHAAKPPAVDEHPPASGLCECGARAVVLYVLYKEIVEHHNALRAWKNKRPDSSWPFVDLLSRPSGIQWHASCAEHVSDAGGPYEIPYPSSWKEWVARTAHLLEKEWFPETNWSDLLYQTGCVGE
jgi:predicted GIY-YIG superfamily endonuclease